MAVRSAHALACAALLLSSGAAVSQEADNRLTILQSGTGNTLTVNQENATGSRVGGLTLSPSTVTGDPFIGQTQQFTTQTVGGASQQVAVTSGTGTGTLTAAPDLSASSTARQRGTDNVADVTISGAGGFVGLVQDNGSPLLAGGRLSGTQPNQATISLNGDGTALVGQFGQGNTADLSVSGAGAVGAILQQGTGNDIGLNVLGTGVSGSLSQIGSNNVSALTVTGAPGTSVSYSLQGNNFTTADPTQGVDVTTNAASVTITQTAFGGTP